MQPPVAIKTHAQLDAPGNGSTLRLDDKGFTSGVGEITVASIDTNVTVRYDYSNDGFSTTIKGPEETYTANGVYAQPILNGYKACRPVFVAETGGTAATLDIVSKLFTD